MYENYYVNVNAQSDGYHEVHKDGCPTLPFVHNRKQLGLYQNCRDVLVKASQYYDKVDGFENCIPECHTR